MFTLYDEQNRMWKCYPTSVFPKLDSARSWDSDLIKIDGKNTEIWYDSTKGTNAYFKLDGRWYYVGLVSPDRSADLLDIKIFSTIPVEREESMKKSVDELILEELERGKEDEIADFLEKYAGVKIENHANDSQGVWFALYPSPIPLKHSHLGKAADLVVRDYGFLGWHYDENTRILSFFSEEE